MISVVSKTALAAFTEEQLITNFCRGLPTAGIQSTMDDAKIPNNLPIIASIASQIFTTRAFLTDFQAAVGRHGCDI
jgi:hypothetical protein